MQSMGGDKVGAANCLPLSAYADSAVPVWMKAWKGNRDRRRRNCINKIKSGVRRSLCVKKVIGRSNAETAEEW